jgi:hypothetical protein
MRKLYCYSHQEFDELMEKLGWENRPDNGNSTISIASKNDEESGHWFNVELNNNINLDFDDLSPEQWWDKDYYDETLDCYLEGISSAEGERVSVISPRQVKSMSYLSFTREESKLPSEIRSYSRITLSSTGIFSLIRFIISSERP